MTPRIDRRQSGRAVCDRPLEFTFSVADTDGLRRESSTGAAVDICEKGRGFFTEFPLKPGHILIVRVAGEEASPGIVRWVAAKGSEFRVGAMLCR